jgi:hypothetical protein
MTDLDKVLNCLDQLDPRMASYESWINAGKVCKDAGGELADWENWSKRDPARYKPSECLRLWNSFSQNQHNPVTIATLIAYTQNYDLYTGNGTRLSTPPKTSVLPLPGREATGRAEIAKPAGIPPVFTPPKLPHPSPPPSPTRPVENFAPRAIPPPPFIPVPSPTIRPALPKELKPTLPVANTTEASAPTAFVLPPALPAATPDWKTLGWGGCEALKRYVKTVFRDGDNINLVTQSKDRKPIGKGQTYKFSSLMEKLDSSSTDISTAIGSYDVSVGAWLRFNSVDGHGISDSNVTDFRFALVESDNLTLDEQYSLLLELRVPIAALVYSGGKSIHAIVRIGAKDLAEYKARVQFLYEYCNKSGLTIDPANRNPSRLSRLPGVLRNGKEQRLIAVNIGATNWESWVKDLPPEITTQTADTIPLDPPEPWGELASQDGIGTELPQWPWDAMPLVLRNVGQSIGTAYDADGSMVAAAILGVASIAIGNKLSVQIKPGHYQLPNLFFMNSAPVGTGKTPILKLLQQPLLKVQEQRGIQHESTIVQQRAQRRCVEAQLRGLEQKIKSSVDKPADCEKIPAEILALQAKLTDEPAAPVVFCGDATSEALGVRLNANGEAIGVLSSEGRKILAIANGRYCDGGDIDLWLAGHAGDFIRIDRMGRPPIVLAHPCIAAYVATQPDAVQKLGENPALRVSGFLARWLYVVSEKERGEYPTAIVCPDALRQYNDLITKLLTLETK